MTSAERFDALLSHKKPDRMPMYIPTIACSVASNILGKPVHTGSDSLQFYEELSWTQSENAHEDFVGAVQENIILLNRTLGADIVREPWRGKARPAKKLDEYTLLFGKEDGPHIVKRYSPETQTYGVVENTSAPKTPEELIARYTQEMERGEDTSPAALVKRYQSQLELKALADPFFPTIVGGVTVPMQMTSPAWLEATLLEPEIMREYYLYRAEIGVKHIQWLSQQGFRFINGGGDIAFNQGPILSPASFRELFVPALTKIADACRKYNMCYCYRTDGNIWSIMDDIFLRAGVQAYGEVDRDATMTVGSIRQKYPDLIILGNISSRTLCTESCEAVREETRCSLEESAGINYIPGPSNAVVHGTPVENVYAMIEEIKRFTP